MKNVRLIITLVALLSASHAFGQPRPTAPVEFQRLSDRLFQITGGRGAHGGVYIGDNGVLVIDAKMDEESVRQVTAGIAKLTDKPTRYLVSTHSDGDHIAGNRYFSKATTFVAHENCRRDFFRPGRDGGPSPWSTPELAPFVPSVTFRNKMDLYLGSKKVELWHFGVGHTTGDTVVYFPEERIAFLGDQIFLTRAQLIHAHKGGNSFEHVKTLSRMLVTIEAERFCSGHSDITDRAGVKRHIEQMKERQATVRALVEEGKSLEETQQQFDESQRRLTGTIYEEISAERDR
ncbi:MAG: MBL fold metallo-hydrolase [Phycisphaerales bacterium]|nr:MAG: MBL fold metallo-hydrolase [Phycisphaerales bacterium]